MMTCPGEYGGATSSAGFSMNTDGRHERDRVSGTHRSHLKESTHRIPVHVQGVKDQVGTLGGRARSEPDAFAHPLAVDRPSTPCYSSAAIIGGSRGSLAGQLSSESIRSSHAQRASNVRPVRPNPAGARSAPRERPAGSSPHARPSFANAAGGAERARPAGSARTARPSFANLAAFPQAPSWAALILRQPPARLLAMICLNIAASAGSLIGSPSRKATVRAVLLSWPAVMMPSGSGTMAPS
jgi:hypothetical protein